MKTYAYTYYHAQDEKITLGYFTKEEIHWLVNNLYDIPTDFYKETVDNILQIYSSVSVAPEHVPKLKQLIASLELRKGINNSVEKVLE